MPRFSLTATTLILTAASCCFSIPAYAEEQSFTDLPKDHIAYEAVEYLKTNHIITGYPDGTFRPDSQVNRAEALKLIIGPLVKEAELSKAKSVKSSFTDVPEDAWFKPYVEIARTSAIIEGPPAKQIFKADSPVLKAEFMKMVEQAFGSDPKTAFSEIRLPLSKDVKNPDDWFYPYIRYGITSSMTMAAADGSLSPTKPLTRSEISLLLYRYIMYTQGRRNQALLSEAQNEIVIILQQLGANNIVEAEYASARALLATRGANVSKPDDPLVQGSVKVAEAFRSILRAYRSSEAKNFDQMIQLSGDAWNLGSRARTLSPELSGIADQIQSIAKDMADGARAKKLQQGSSASSKQ